MNQPAIKVEGMWKEYVVETANDRHRTFYDLLSKSITAPFKRMRELGGRSREDDRFWALRDINFEVQQGQVLGVIGRNGAGKSTLLKILSRITAPSRGRVTVQGRMASLLEVGTGFHPELSGRENIYLNGALLGMTRSDIGRRFDEIVDFAEIGRFIDTPVKRYSSGMYVRLAFSVAAHLEPDILVIDEVLAVGDAEFQKKCLGRLESNQNEGRTVIVVSHNMTMVKQLCTSAIWLDKGSLIKSGSITVVASEYLSSSRVRSSEWIPATDASDAFSYERVAILAPRGSTPDAISAASSFQVEFRFCINAPVVRGRIAFQVRDANDNVIFASASTDGKGTKAVSWDRGKHCIVCEIPSHFLCPGNYFLTISKPLTEGDQILENICKFTIDSSDSLVSLDGRVGFLAPMLKWSLQP